MPGTAKVIRVTLRYGAQAAEIVDVTPIHGPAPVDDWRPTSNSSGAWIELKGPDGKIAFAQPLPDPFIGREVFADDEYLARRRRSAAQTVTATIEVPWTGEGSRLLVHARRARSKKGAGSRIATLALEPNWLSFEGTKFPMTVYPRWGWQNPQALSLVFMSEAFRADELAVFAAGVEKTLTAFEATEPFKSMLPGLRAVRIDIPSQESGIGTQRHKTHFKGRFTVPRVIEVDQTIAARVLSDHVNSSAVAMVLANTTQYGGSGGAAMVFSLEPNWSTEIAIHELGHARFHLADEYSASGQAATLEPVEKNVSKFPDRARLKWAAQVDPATPLPTQSFGQPDPTLKPVGAYEGAKYKEKGVYRPAWMCKMREVGQPFCPVCSQIITDLLTPHMP